MNGELKAKAEERTSPREVKCPSCGIPLADPAPRCPHCKFALQKVDAKFGAVPRHSSYLTDRSGWLPLPEIARLRALLRLFHKKFPQSLFSIFVADLPEDVSVGEFAFWLSNRARFSSAARVGAENFDLLLVVDLTANAAAFTAGYGFEEHLEESDLLDVLKGLSEGLDDTNLAGGLSNVIERLTRLLRARSRQARELELRLEKDDE
jgi:uncharacterized membrane protein YgcG